MNIIFMGTPDFAVKSAQALSEQHNIVCIVTQPDKPKGRGNRLCAPPVKEWAIRRGIEVYQPDTLKDGALLPLLERHKPDVIVVVAYGRILPDYILRYPRYGCVNVHASLLPKYRGAAPIQWAIINGETESGVCTMFMDSGLDTGAVLKHARTPIVPDMTAGDLYEVLSEMGARLICETLNEIDHIVPAPQDDSRATYAPVITKDMARIDWTKDARSIVNLIRGMNPSPITFTFDNGEMLKIYGAQVGEESGKCGEVLGIRKGSGLCVAAGSGSVYIKELQAQGGKRMSAEDFLRGNSIGERLG